MANTGSHTGISSLAGAQILTLKFMFFNLRMSAIDRPHEVRVVIRVNANLQGAMIGKSVDQVFKSTRSAWPGRHGGPRRYPREPRCVLTA